MVLIGAGTENDPYLVATYADFLQVSTYAGVGKYFKQTEDIILGYRDGKLPLPSFTGVYDGNFKKWTGMEIYSSLSSPTSGWGIFKYINNATIKNIKVQGCSVYAGNTIGLFAGESYGATVFENVLLENTSVQTYALNTNWHTVGGFVGRAYNPITFRYCGIKGGQSRAYNTLGGFVGYGNSNTFEQCYNNFVSMYTNSGGHGAFASNQTPTQTVTNSYSVPTTASLQGAVSRTDVQMKDMSQLPLFDSSKWGTDATYNGGYASPKGFLPVLEPPVYFTVNVMTYVKTLGSQIAWVNVVHPLIKAIHVNSHSNPISTAYTITLQEVVDKQIRLISQLGNIDTKSKRLALEKSIGNIVSHLNQITGHLVITKDITPEIFDNLSSLLESGNDISFIQHLINDVYINESRHSTIDLQSKSEVNVLAYTGDTVTLKVNFKTYEDVAIEPTDVKVKIYQPTSTTDFELISTISLDPSSKTGIGEYQYTYTIPENIHNSSFNFLVYEFSGMYNGQATLVRGKFSIRFV